MLIISDLHGNHQAVRRLVRRGEPLVILGDFLNYVDYRTGEGMVAEVLGLDFALQVAALRAKQDFVGWRELWGQASGEFEGDIRAAFDRVARRQYDEMREALVGASGYATFGNVDVPELLKAALPTDMSFAHGEVVELAGYRIGFVGGAHAAPLEGSISVSESDVESLLSSFGHVDILCSHIPPAIDPLRIDVITGHRERASQALLDYVTATQPEYHLFGDVHQPQAARWKIGSTHCQNVGYFRATGRPFELPNRI